MVPALMEAHRARQERLKRMGGWSPKPVAVIRQPVPEKPVPPIVFPFQKARPKTEPKPTPKLGLWFYMLPDDPEPINILYVQQAVANYFKLELEELLSVRGSPYVAVPRQIGMYLCHRVLLNKSLSEIGRRFDRDHSTVMHATRKVEQLARADDDLGCAIRDLETRLRELRKAQKSAEAT